jgi:hypothetical protein
LTLNILAENVFWCNHLRIKKRFITYIFSTTDIYNEIQKSIFLKNPCYNVADLVLTNPVITIVNYQTNKPQYSLVPANAGADASEISIKYVTNTVNGETPQEAAVKAILVFISESFTPQEIGYQVR